MAAGASGKYMLELDTPATGYAAAYAELIFPADGGSNLGLCTPVKVLGDKHP